MTSPDTSQPQTERICARLSEQEGIALRRANDPGLDDLTRWGSTASAAAYAHAQRIVREETESETGVTPVGRLATPEERAAWDQMLDAAREEQRP